MDTISKSRFTGTSLRTAAVISGAGLLLMAILAPIAYLNTFQSLVKFDDAALTAQNILNSMGAFRAAMALLFVVALLDIIVAWAMYIVFLPADKKLSAWTAWLRVIYGVIFAFAISQLPIALRVISTDSAQAMSHLKAFQSIWDKSLILFGFHLLLLGYLAFKSGYVPKWLAIFLLLAALGYIGDGFGKMLYSCLSASYRSRSFGRSHGRLITGCMFEDKRSKIIIRAKRKAELPPSSIPLYAFAIRNIPSPLSQLVLRSLKF